MMIMRILGKWGIAATFVCCGLLFLACGNNDNNAPDTSTLDLWQAGKTVTNETVTAYGGIDKCFAAEPIPDGVWQRMQGKTFKENPHIGRDGTLLIQPATGEPYCDRSWNFPYKIDHEDLCFRLFTEAGFEWGGDWTTRKDYQHFELIE